MNCAEKLFKSLKPNAINHWLVAVRSHLFHIKSSLYVDIASTELITQDSSDTITRIVS